MVKFENDKSLFVDCDDTLVLYDDDEWEGHKEYDSTILIDNNGYMQRVLPHYRHIQMIKRFKFLGYKVVVWSLTGAWWAEKVVKTLGIENYVDMVMSKPLFHCDDQEDVRVIVGKRIYMNRK